MARIPVYEQRTQLGGQIQGGRISGQSALADAATSLSRSIEGFADRQLDFELKQKRLEEQKREDRAAVDVANVLSKGDVAWQEDYDNLTKTWKPGDPDMRETIRTKFEKWREETKAGLPTEKSRNFFDRNAATMLSRLELKAYEYQDKVTVDKLNADTLVGMKADEDAVYRDPERLPEVKARRLATLEAQTGLSAAQKVKIGQQYSIDMDMAVERGKLARDPAKYLEERRLQPAPKPGETQPAPVQVSPPPAPVSKVMGALIHQESRGKHRTADGQLVTSAKGAQGITQLMPATAANPGYGVAPVRDQSEAEYIRFANDYFGAMLREYNGDQSKALAAYNAGPGRVNEAVRKHGANWLANLPKETQDYVKNINARAASAEPPAQAAGAPAAKSAGAAPSGGTQSVGYSTERRGPETFERLPYEQREALLATAESKLKQKNAQYESEMNRMMADATAMHVDGKQDTFNLQPENFDRAYGADGPRRYQEYMSSKDMASDIEKFRTLTPEQIQTSLKESRTQVDALAKGQGTGYAAADKRQELREQAAKTVIEEQQKDPQSYAMKAGLSQSQPLDFSDKDKLSAGLAGRVGTARMMSEQHKTPYRLLTEPEVKQFVQIMEKLPAVAKAEYIETIRQSLSDPVAYRSVMSQIAPDSPVTAVAGSIIAKAHAFKAGGGIFSEAMQIDPRKVGVTILQGEAILNPTKEGKKQDGRAGNFPMPKDKDMELAFADYVGDSFRGDPFGYSAAYQAFRAFYAGKAAEMGILSDVMEPKIVKEALPAVTGGVIDYNGNGKVLKPWGMGDGMFQDTVKRQFDQAMEANGYKGTRMDNLSAYGVKSLRENEYLLVSGNQTLLDKAGNPIIISTKSPFIGARVTRESAQQALPPAVPAGTHIPAPATPPRKSIFSSGAAPPKAGPENKSTTSGEAPSIYASEEEWAEYRKRGGR